MKQKSIKQTLMVAATLAALLSGSNAFAQDTNVAIDNLEMAPGSEAGILNAQSEGGDETPYHPSFGFTLRYDNDSLAVVDAGTNEVKGKPVDLRYSADLSAQMAFTQRFSLGFNMPVILKQNGDLSAYNGGGSLPAAAAGDLRLTPKVNLYNSDKFGLGLGASVYAPTGTPGAFATDGTFRLQPNVMARMGQKARLMANLGYQIRPERQVLTYGSDNMLRWVVAGDLPVTERVSLQGSLYGNLGTAAARKMAEDNVGGRSAEALAGVNVHLGNGFSTRAGLGTGFNSAPGSSKIRAYASLQYRVPTREAEECPEPSTIEIPVEVPVEKECPKCEEKPAPRVIITKDKVEVSERIHFETDKSRILPRSYSILKELAQVIEANPQITRIRVEGHTDHRAPEAYNQALSERRAKAVVRFLVRQGVDAERLEAVGYGEARPIATNKTEAGMALNRRVEFRIIEIKGQAIEPTDKIVTESETKVEVQQ